MLTDHGPNYKTLEPKQVSAADGKTDSPSTQTTGVVKLKVPKDYGL
jgi:hypothetical protein